MRAAPAVDATLDAGRRERMLIAGLHVVAAAALGGWLVLLVEPTVPWLGWAAVAIALWSAALWGRRVAQALLPPGASTLCWDGRSWTWADPSLRAVDRMPLVELTVAIDLGAWMLLRLRPAAGAAPAWRVATERSAGAAWHGLRLALRAHAGAAGASDPAASPDRPQR